MTQFRFKSIDIFYQTYKLSIAKKDIIQSNLGSILTIIVILSSVGLLISQAQNLLYKTKVNVNLDKIYDFNPDTVKVNEDMFTVFSYNLQNSNKFLLNKSYFNISIVNYYQTRGYDNNGKAYVNVSRLPIDWELCGNNLTKHQNKFNKHGNFTEILQSKAFESHICILNDSVLIGGEYNSPLFSNILFEITRCKNTTFNNSTCKPDAEITSSISGVNFEVNYIDNTVRSNNHSDPFQAFFNNYYIKLDPTIFQTVDIYFSKIEIFSDDGWIFEGFNYLDRYSFDYFREISILKPTDSKILRIYINISKNRYLYKRYYTKVQDLAALMGGMFKALSLISLIILYFFNRYKYDELLINQLYDIEKLSKIDGVYQNDTPIGKQRKEEENHNKQVMSIVNKNGNNENEKRKFEKEIKKSLNLIKKNNIDRNERPINVNLSFSRSKLKKSQSYLHCQSGSNVFKIGYLDIISFTFCLFNKENKRKKLIFDCIRKDLYGYIDYSEIVKEVILMKSKKNEKFSLRNKERKEKVLI